jgi:RHH-type rel operon transcriptional repressor/antitoxin RelB
MFPFCSIIEKRCCQAHPLLRTRDKIYGFADFARCEAIRIAASRLDCFAPLPYMYSNRNPAMLALRLPPEIEQRLDALAKRTGRSKSYYAREAILRHIEDIEDTYLARNRRQRGGSRVTLESLERDLARRSKT